MRRGFLLWFAIAMLVGCDTVAPVDDSRLVVEGFLDSGHPLPEMYAARTLSPGRPHDAGAAAVSDAAIEIVVAGVSVSYRPSRPGTYVPEGSLTPSPGQAFTFHAAWNGMTATTTGIIPPQLRILDVTLSIPDEPVSAVLLDSLALADSLTTGLYTGYIYPIEATVSWRDSTVEGWSLQTSWIRAQLKPVSTFSSPVVDLFLRSEEIFRETERRVVQGARAWTGVYAVGVAEADDPLPPHLLRVALVRSDPAYARFAASRSTPERREPISNVGIGVVAAVSVDSVRIDVGADGSTRLR